MDDGKTLSIYGNVREHFRKKNSFTQNRLKFNVLATDTKVHYTIYLHFLRKKASVTKIIEKLLQKSPTINVSNHKFFLAFPHIKLDRVLSLKRLEKESLFFEILQQLPLVEYLAVPVILATNHSSLLSIH